MNGSGGYPDTRNCETTKTLDKMTRTVANLNPIPLEKRSQSHKVPKGKLIDQWNNAACYRHLYSILQSPNVTIYENTDRSFTSRARTIITQSYLFCFGFAETPLCLVYREQKEALQHILLPCPLRIKAQEELKLRLRADLYSATSSD